MLAKNSLSKYLIYAFGEVFLVVIGILLALQINTWNEMAKDRKQELLALKDLKNEFESNKDDLSFIIQYKKGVEQLWDEYLTNITNKNLPDSIRGMDRPTLGNRAFKISNVKLNSLLSTGKIDKIQNDSLKHLLIIWNDILGAGRDPENLYREQTRNFFGPYEATLKPRPKEAMKRISGTDISFYTKEEIEKMNITALEDLNYRNYLISNLHWLRLQVRASLDLNDSYDTVISLLEREISTKEK